MTIESESKVYPEKEKKLTKSMRVERERDKKCLKKMQHNYVFRWHYLTYIDCQVCLRSNKSIIFMHTHTHVQSVGNER